MSSIFTEAEAARPRRVGRLGRSVLDELLLRCFLSIDADAALDAPCFPVITAKDASLHHGAIVAATRPLEEVAWLWSRASLHGAYSNLMWAPTTNLNDELILVDGLMLAWIEGIQLKDVLSYRLQRAAHINALELQADAVRTAKTPIAGRARHGGILDSGMRVGAIGRGRSSSRCLNRILRSSLPFVGPTGILEGPAWTCSADNSAGDPIRGRSV